MVKYTQQRFCHCQQNKHYQEKMCAHLLHTSLPHRLCFAVLEVLTEVFLLKKVSLKMLFSTLSRWS